mmetsp:Transcript_11715/g.40475  ORF Transcript_11715/g.40475 Transcript_11715/m.40475 type:complete len:284 (-) Transcript_11715:2050-2901(-)
MIFPQHVQQLIERLCIEPSSSQHVLDLVLVDFDWRRLQLGSLGRLQQLLLHIQDRLLHGDVGNELLDQPNELVLVEEELVGAPQQPRKVSLCYISLDSLRLGTLGGEGEGSDFWGKLVQVLDPNVPVIVLVDLDEEIGDGLPTSMGDVLDHPRCVHCAAALVAAEVGRGGHLKGSYRHGGDELAEVEPSSVVHVQGPPHDVLLLHAHLHSRVLDQTPELLEANEVLLGELLEHLLRARVAQLGEVEGELGGQMSKLVRLLDGLQPESTDELVDVQEPVAVLVC